MRKQKTWIGLGQITYFREETTSIWLKRGLDEAGHDVAALQQFVSYLCAVSYLYETFRPDMALQVIYYSEEIFEAYNQDDWTWVMLRNLMELKGAFMHHHWAMVWRRYYRKMYRRFTNIGPESLPRLLEALDTQTRVAMQDVREGLGEKIIAEMAADASLTAPG